MFPTRIFGIGGGGRRVLSIAGREADIVSINVDLRGGKGDASVAPNAAPEQTRRKIAWVKEAANGGRNSPIYDQREYDAVVASGEQVTSGLLALALQGQGLPAGCSASPG